MRLLLIASLLFVAAEFTAAAETFTSLRVTMNDGSEIMVRPHGGSLRIVPDVGQRKFPVKWELISGLECDPDKPKGTVSFANGDRLTFQWAGSFLKVKTSFGQLRIPVDKVSKIENLGEQVEAANIALGKPVYGKDGASHGKGLARHVTDGDYQSHAKPPASHFDYRVDLRDDQNKSFSVTGVTIHWGRFGDCFKGIPAANGDGWASAAWPGEYVTSYRVEYRSAGSENWTMLHEHNGRPADEETDHVAVRKLPTDLPGCSSESISKITGLDLEGVAEIRISATGGHWIGLHELEVFGKPDER